MKLQEYDRRKLFEYIYIIFAFAFLMMWMMVQPFSVSPDEQMRYLIPEFIYNNGYLPHGGDPSIRNEQWGISYGFTPITSYIISAAFMKIASIFSTDFMFLLKAARLVNVLFGTGTVYIIIKIGKQAFKKPYDWLFIIVTSTLPQFVFMNSYINMDSMALFGCALLFYMWIYGKDNNWNTKACIGTGIAVSICTLSYYNTYGFILCTVIYFVASNVIANKDNKNWFIILIKKGLIITGVVLLLTGWWFIRNYIIYDGDILGLNTSNQYGEKYAVENLKPSNILTPMKEGKSILDMLLGGWIKVTVVSFLGCFGAIDITMPIYAYIIYCAFIVLGITGLVIKLLNIKKAKTKDDYVQAIWFNGSGILVILITIGLSIYYSYASDYQPQGRYILPMMVPFFYLIVSGHIKLMEMFKVTDKYKKYICNAIGSIYIGLIMYCYCGVYLPVYKG